MTAHARSAWPRVLAPLALMGLIFYFSAQPAAADVAWWEPIARKLGHITGYAALTLLWSWALAGVVRRPVLWAAAISLAYACTDEYHQTLVESRHGTIADVGVDAVGIALAAVAIYWRVKRPRLGGSEARRAEGAA